MSANKQKGLGKGLGAFFGAAAVSANEAKVEVGIEELVPNPHQPRKLFDEEKLAELVSSITEHGIIQPLIVRKTKTGYEIVAGERRWRASKKAGLEKVPVVIREYTDQQIREIALVENIQRDDLNPIEEAQAFRGLMESLDLTQEEVAQKVGRSRSAVANVLRLLNLPEELQQLVSRGTLNMGQARPLLSLSTESQQLAVAKRIIANEMSAREVENYIKKLGKAKEKNAKPLAKDIYITEIQDKLTLSLGTQVQIKKTGKRGKIIVDFYSDTDLDRLLELLLDRKQQTSAKTKQGTPFTV